MRTDEESKFLLLNEKRCKPYLVCTFFVLRAGLLGNVGLKYIDSRPVFQSPFRQMLPQLQSPIVTLKSLLNLAI